MGSMGGSGRAVARPLLFERLGTAAQVTVVSAPAGSGKTVLLRSWIGAAGLAGRAAWVPVRPEERDPRRFWLEALTVLRATGPGSQLVRAVTAAPDLDGWALTERLLKDLAPLEDRLWLVVDDVHELGSAEALQQLELVIMRAPPPLLFVLATRAMCSWAGPAPAAAGRRSDRDPNGRSEVHPGRGPGTVQRGLPVRVSVPGPATMRRLLAISSRCGVAVSAPVAARYGFSLIEPTGIVGPGRFIRTLGPAMTRGCTAR